MRRKLPSLRALESFEAVHKHGNVTRAAEELGRTQSAVSRQIANLEQFVGHELFVRDRRKLVITDIGKHYSDKIVELLDRIEEETTKLSNITSDDHVLRLGVLPTLACRWLMPRLTGFITSGSSTELHLVKGLGRFDFEQMQVDATIECCSEKPAGLICHHLFDEKIVAVISPELYNQGDTEKYSRLYMPARSKAWDVWANANEVPATTSSIKFENYSMMIEAACLGLGIAIVPTIYVNQDLETNKLIAPFGEPVPSDRGYWLTYTESSASRPKVIELVEWLTHQSVLN